MQGFDVARERSWYVPLSQQPGRQSTPRPSRRRLKQSLPRRGQPPDSVPRVRGTPTAGPAGQAASGAASSSSCSQPDGKSFHRVRVPTGGLSATASGSSEKPCKAQPPTGLRPAIRPAMARPWRQVAGTGDNPGACLLDDCKPLLRSSPLLIQDLRRSRPSGEAITGSTMPNRRANL